MRILPARHVLILSGSLFTALPTPGDEAVQPLCPEDVLQKANLPKQSLLLKFMVGAVSSVQMDSGNKMIIELVPEGFPRPGQTFTVELSPPIEATLTRLGIRDAEAHFEQAEVTVRGQVTRSSTGKIVHHRMAVMDLSQFQWIFKQAPPPEPAKRPPTNQPPGNPPRILVACGIDAGGNLLLVNHKTIYIGFDGTSYNNRHEAKAPLKDVAIYDNRGNRLSLEAARTRLGGQDTPILVYPRGTTIPAFYRRLFTGDALHFVFPQLAPAWKEIQEPERPLG